MENNSVDKKCQLKSTIITIIKNNSDEKKLLQQQQKELKTIIH